MNCNNDCGFRACSCFGVIISVVLGAIVGVLFAFNYIAAIVTSAWIALGIAVLALVFLLVLTTTKLANPNISFSSKTCANARCLIVGAIGTIVAALIALSIILDVTSTPVIILVSIGAFFLSLTIIALAALLQSVMCKLCEGSEG